MNAPQQDVWIKNFLSTFLSMQCSLIKSKDLSRQALKASALAKTSRTSGRFSSLVTVGFLPFTKNYPWKDWMYTLSFSFSWIVDPVIRIMKKFDFMTLTCPCQLINSHQPTLSTYKNSTSFLKFRIPSLVTRSTKFGNFLNDMSFLATKYAMLALLLSRLSSSSDTLVSISFRSTSAGILKLTV